MKNLLSLALLCLLATGAASAAARRKPVPGKSATVKPAAIKTPSKAAKSNRNANAGKSATRKTASSRKFSSRSRRATAQVQPARQAAPSSDRYKEIQEALVAKGYMSTPPNGQWDQNAQDAMRKFQADQNLSVSGKLSSRSIIALGLGSPSAAIPPAPPASAPASTGTLPPKP